MTISYPVRCVCIGLIGLLSTCNPLIEPAFDTERRYKHELYSPDECVRISQANAEFNCSEVVYFNANGTAGLLLGGGDIIVSATYQRKGQKITVQPSTSLPEEIVFRVITDGELVRMDDNTRWFIY
ncbi:hypothetical protein [Spirosoma agri]|uniref:Uncharacterized protein n=1 Tax=Spirosoma agri TaxID=1987381 RepID=A0A6M0ICM8_9BACT|nr:hypothetical protein [Spirosoma agri]NEU65858.1 hypothetical protein [Spirosoma agri]